MHRNVILIVLGLLLSIVSIAESSTIPPDAATVFENDYLLLKVGVNGSCLQFVDKASGQDYCSHDAPAPFATLSKGGQAFIPTITAENGTMTLTFAEASARAVLTVRTEPHYLVIEVVDVTGEGVDSLTFGNVPLTLKGALTEPFAACALALNLQTNVPEIPGPNAQLHATCYARFGFPGAAVGIIGCPQSELRNVMKEVVSSAKGLPRTDIGGPWALDAPGNRGSYLFDFGDVTEQTVDTWIAFAKQLGLNQIDFHTGHSLRFGDCRPNPSLFPNGRASVKAVIDKLHAAGIQAGLHTYAFFMAKDTPYITPVPDPRLGKKASFTLAGDVSAETTDIPVDETTVDVSNITGFFVRNSVTLQIDNELMTFTAASKEPPFTFTGCTRGALGTQAAPHAKGAKVHQLKECFGLFAPDADSTLLAEIANNTASTFNECGFDMIYLDALDGEDILGGAENSWHYGSKFVFEVANRLERPALFEMSTFHHHLWYVRARIGAQDHPSRSHKRFIDTHVAANESGAGMFLPATLGWWAVKTWQSGANAAWLEPTYPDDIEYLMTKCLGTNSGFALMGVNPGNIGKIPAYQRLAPIFKQYEELRHARYFSDAICERLKAPGAEFTLEATVDGAWRMRPVKSMKYKVDTIDGWKNVWNVENPFTAQPAQFRIEALMAVAPYDAPEAVVLEDFANPASTMAERKAQEGVACSLETVVDLVKTGGQSGRFSASNARSSSAGAWCQTGKVYETPLNIANQPALGVWVYGDGQNETLNFQYRSPEHTTAGGIGDHYIKINFMGWRYFELFEFEGGAVEDHAWPYGGGYAIYRESVDFGQVHRFSMWYNDIPANGQVACALSPVHALPVLPGKLTNPSLLISGTRVVLPVAIESGSYLEFRSMTDCKLYGPEGQLLREVIPQGDVPMLTAGANTVVFEAQPLPGQNVRANVQITSRGESLQ